MHQNSTVIDAATHISKLPRCIVALGEAHVCSTLSLASSSLMLLSKQCQFWWGWTQIFFPTSKGGILLPLSTPLSFRQWMLWSSNLLQNEPHFFFFFFCVPQLYLWGSPLWVRFLRMWPFFNPTIKAVTFRLRGWCVLGVFLLPAFTRLGRERQDLLSPCDEMHVCTD